MLNNTTSLTGKQKRYLRALGSEMNPVVQIGKGGLDEAVVESAAQVLAARELIKVRVLRNSPDSPEILISELADRTGAELVQIIGHNGLLYKRNPEKARIELP